METAPPVKFAARTDRDVHFVSGPVKDLKPSAVALATAYPATEGVVYSGDGSRVALLNTDSVDVYDAETDQRLLSIGRRHVSRVSFSPKSKYLVTWDRKGDDGKESLFVWDLSTGKDFAFLRSSVRDVSDEQWPLVKWTDDESLLGLLLPVPLPASGVRSKSGSMPDGILRLMAWPPATHDAPAPKEDVIRAPGLNNFAIAPGPASPCLIATFAPAFKDAPAKVQILVHPSLEVSRTRSTRTFFNADSAILKWSPNASALLVIANTERDRTGDSYYGSSSLHLLHADGSKQWLVPFGENKGPVHDAAWAPNGNDFAVIQGQQPAKALLFQAATCTPIRDFGMASRNTIRWSPHGRFIMLGGFRNLAGEMDFWDRGRFKLLGSTVDYDKPQVYEWTPDGRHLVTGVLRPYRRVDNGLKVFTYYGERVYAEKIEQLHGVAVRPAPPGTYPDRPQSPGLAERKRNAEKAAPQSAKPQAYVPPALRNKGQGPSQIMERKLEGPRDRKSVV